MKSLPAKEFLQYAIGIALIVCSLAFLMLSFATSPAKAAPLKATVPYQTVGVVLKDNKILVVGYSPDPPMSETSSVKILASWPSN
jgi:hypothetical protein